MSSASSRSAWGHSGSEVTAAEVADHPRRHDSGKQ